MSFFVLDAALLGLKEALKLIAVWFLFKAYLQNTSSENLLKPFYIGLGLASLVFVSSFFWPPEREVIWFFSALVKYVFFIFFMGSLVLLYLEQKGGRSDASPRGLFISGVVLFLTVLYFSPDIVSSSLRIRELAFMRGNVAGTYISGALAFLIPLPVLFSLLRKRGRGLGTYFGLGQLLLVLTLVKLLGGGPGASGNLSLIPAVQRGSMKLVHDFVHQIFVFLLVPDHPLLTIEVWTYIGFFFGPNFGLAAALFLLLLPPLTYLYAAFTTPLLISEAPELASERRKLRAAARRKMQKKALPVVVFILVVFVSWYTKIGASTTQLYLPQPKPVVEDRGMIILPLTDPTMDLMDGNLYKFSITREDEAVNFLVIKRPDGKLAVTLDACEICPPEGYGLALDKVVCVYCRTPIPLESLGKAGGCNPIPLTAEITDKNIRISVYDLDDKWQRVKSGKTKEGIR